VVGSCVEWVEAWDGIVRRKCTEFPFYCRNFYDWGEEEWSLVYQALRVLSHLAGGFL